MKSVIRHFALLAALLAAQAYGSAQITQPILGTEIFITHNWGLNGITGGTTYWDNVVVQDSAGAQYTITLTSLTQTGTGVFGPIYTEGAYTLEYFWLGSTFVNGITPGHLHTTAGIGNPAPSEGTHGNGTLQNQGFIVRHSTGQQIQLVSIDYQNALEPFLIGTSYNLTIGYTDINTWTNFGPVEGVIMNATTFNTFTFVVIPPDVATLKMAVSPPATLAFNTSNNSVSVTGQVASYVTIGGIEITNPTADPVIGASFTIAGNYFGSDLNGLSDIVITPCVANLIVSGSDALTMTTQVATSAGSGDTFELAGPLGCTVNTLRSMGSLGTVATSRTGSGSVVLDILNINFATQPLGLVFELANGYPTLRSVEKAYVLPTVTPQFNINTNGAGSCEVGIIGYGPISRVYNLLTLNPTNPTVGSGPFFGMQFQPIHIIELNAPIGSHPMHVTSNSNGNYFWGTAATAAPPGLIVDTCSVELPNASSTVGFISPVIRRTF